MNLGNGLTDAHGHPDQQPMPAAASAPLRVLSVFGTRPEAIKMAPVVRELERYRGEIVSRVCVTAQHRELLDEVLELFEIEPDYDLDVMQRGQSPTTVAADVMRGLEPVLVGERPDWVLVQGDTTTAAMGAIAAFYAGARVGHVEAGLRSNVPREPFPEELNRRLATVSADLHLAPTGGAALNLLAEGIDATSIVITGNPVIDALHAANAMPAPRLPELDAVPADKRIVVVTAHRRESFGPPLERICNAIGRLVAGFPEVHVVLPAHPNPSVRFTLDEHLPASPAISVIEPLGYRAMVELLNRATLVLTDSGGLQEEAPSLGKPVLVLRDITERAEGIEAGACRLVGTDEDRIVAEAGELLSSPLEYALASRAVNPYGDGRAAARIVDALRGLPVDEWRPALAPAEQLAS
jgi:UDP-N-acetylglucosamine 2-epimerase (non-hydrolysing)